MERCGGSSEENTMTKFWRFFISNGKGSRGCARLGVRGYGVPVFASLRRRWHLRQASGVEVWRVDAGSPAERAGVLAGDLLLTVAEQPVGTVNRLRRLMAEIPDGMPVELTFLRGDNKVARWIVPDDNRRS
jgi:S1-C subfamily serine protease